MPRFRSSRRVVVLGLTIWTVSLSGGVSSLLAAPGLRSQGTGKPAPDEQTGLEVGAKAPKFTLKDQAGKERSLDEFLGKGKVALVFYRSADW
jgi:cytochrome oxidase Cu insertion factor (SCO1/SenC/PrrC family)